MASAVRNIWLRLPWRNRITVALVLWLVAESLAFALVVKLVGVLGALLLGLAASLVGASLAKRLGRSAFAGLRHGAGEGFAALQSEAALERVFAGLGAVLLILPGFLTDALGLILAIAPVRSKLAGWIGGGGVRAAQGRPRAQHGPAQIDLERGDWRADEDIRGAAPKA